MYSRRQTNPHAVVRQREGNSRPENSINGTNNTLKVPAEKVTFVSPGMTQARIRAEYHRELKIRILT